MTAGTFFDRYTARARLAGLPEKPSEPTLPAPAEPAPEPPTESPSTLGSAAPAGSAGAAATVGGAAGVAAGTASVELPVMILPSLSTSMSPPVKKATSRTVPTAGTLTDDLRCSSTLMCFVLDTCPGAAHTAN